MNPTNFDDRLFEIIGKMDQEMANTQEKLLQERRENAYLRQRIERMQEPHPDALRPEDV